VTLSVDASKIDYVTRYRIAGLICVAFIATRYFFPDFYDNEWAYTLGPIHMANAGFLAHDPFIRGISSTFDVYNILVSPLYLFLSSLSATLACRVCIWAFEVWTLMRLSKTIGLSWWAFILLFVLWLDVEQTLVAGEWIIECATAKPVAYGFVFLALDSLLKGKLKLSGLFSGIALSFHVAVGFWSAVALFTTILITRYGKAQVRQIVWFCVAALVFSLPGLLPALRSFLQGQAAGRAVLSGSEVARLSVLVANPFHLDPRFFITGLEYVKVGLYLIVTLMLIKFLFSKEEGRIFSIFILALSGIFISGLIARSLQWYSFLQYYPFRVFDAFLPLSFWMAVSLLIQKYFYKLEKGKIGLFLMIPVLIGVVNYLNDRCEPKPSYSATLQSFTSALLHTEPRLTAYNMRERGREWYEKVFARKRSDLEDMENFIKRNTPADSIFITPPDTYSFSLKAERAEFVSLKYVPVNGGISDWKRRLEILNGGPLHGVGFEIPTEVRDNFQKLTKDELISIKRRFGADYILTTAAASLDLQMVYENRAFALYKL
jgi:hypothetical protein